MLKFLTHTFIISCASASLLFFNFSLHAEAIPTSSNYLDSLTMTSVGLLATNLKSYTQTSDVGIATTAGGTFIAGDVLITLQIKEVIKDLTDDFKTGVPDQQQIDSLKKLRDSYIATITASSKKYEMQKASAASFSAAALAAVELGKAEEVNEKACMKGFDVANTLAASVHNKCADLQDDPAKKDDGDKCMEELNSCATKIAADKTVLLLYKEKRDAPGASVPTHEAVKVLGAAAITALGKTAEICSNYTKELAAAEASGACEDKIDFNEGNESFGKLDPKSNKDILSSLGIDSKSSAAFINVSGNSISKDLDQNILTPKHRAIVWGGMQQLAEAAAAATAAEMKTIQSNIDKLNTILAKVGELPKGMVVGDGSSDDNTNKGYLPWTDKQIKDYFATNPSVEDIKKRAANLTDAQIATAYRIAGNTLPDGVTQTPGLDPKTGLLLGRLIPVGQSGMYPTASTRGGVDGYHPKTPQAGINESYTYPASSGSSEGHWDNSTGQFVRAGNWHDGKFEYIDGKGPADRELYSGSLKRMDGSTAAPSSVANNSRNGDKNFSPATSIDWSNASVEQISNQSKAWSKEGMQISEQAYRAAEAGVPLSEINKWVAQNSGLGRLQVDNAYAYYQQEAGYVSMKGNLNNNWHHLTDEEMLYNAQTVNTMGGSNWDNSKLFASLLYPGGMQGSGTVAPVYVPLHPEDITFVGGANGSSSFDASKNTAYVKWANDMLKNPIEIKQMAGVLGKTETQFRKDLLASYNGTPTITSGIKAIKERSAAINLSKKLPCLTNDCSSVSNSLNKENLKSHSSMIQNQIKNISALGDKINGAKSITNETLKAAAAVSTEQEALKIELKNQLQNKNSSYEKSALAFKEKLKESVRDGMKQK